jgi:hypothetical protein
MSYLYAASIKGIQGFIFASNKLQEIIGASEIIKEIEEDFKNEIKKYKATLLMSAAGNMKAVFKEKKDLQEFLLNFSKNAIKKAYGISLVEAVTEIKSENPTQEEIKIIEKRLMIQRNKLQIPIDFSINILKLAPSSAKPVYFYSKDKEALDKSAFQKRVTYQKWFKEQQRKNPAIKEYKEIDTLANKKGKIAVIHIDGNGLGALLSQGKIKNISEFSKKLDKATKEAFKKSKKNYKLREVILGGDDVTVICNADIALDFTYNFLTNFENETEKIPNTDGLTACAGIAYCNKKFPFHYAVDLAENLCSLAKKESKKINNKKAPSSLMFHNIQSSVFKSWEETKKNELIINGVECQFGPYFLNRNPKIKNLIEIIKLLKKESSLASKMRKWLITLEKNYELAEILLNRINEITDSKIKDEINNSFTNLDNRLSLNNLIIDNKTPVYDILQIISITGRENEI